MKLSKLILTATLGLAASYAMAQVMPGGPPMGGQQPGMGQPGGMHLPGVGEPGMGGTSTTPGMQQSRVDDQTLDRQIHDELRTQAEMSHVQARVENGMVYLEGSVPRKEDRKQAEKLVQAIPGVRGVKNKLKVEPTTTSELSGASHEPSTAGSIAGNTQAKSGTTVAGNGNPASNPGMQGTMPQSSPGASSAAGGTAGAAVPAQPAGTGANQGASNPVQSTVGSLGTPTSSSAGVPSAAAGSNEASYGSQAPSPQLQQMIDNALRNEPTLAHDSVSASVSDTKIDLNGTVGSGKEKQTAMRIAQSYARNRKVIDHLTVAGGTTGANTANPTPRP